jgi:hypothetical protein
MKYHQLAKFERKDVILAPSLNVFSFYFTSRKDYLCGRTSASPHAQPQLTENPYRFIVN